MKRNFESVAGYPLEMFGPARKEHTATTRSFEIAIPTESPRRLTMLEFNLLRYGQKLFQNTKNPDDIWFYGQELANVNEDGYDYQRLINDGTLYRALKRLNRYGLLITSPESPEEYNTRGLTAPTPPRKYFAITPFGLQKLAEVSA